LELLYLKVSKVSPAVSRQEDTAATKENNLTYLSSLLLLVLGIFANHHDLAVSLYDFALFANGLYGSSNLHF